LSIYLFSWLVGWNRAVDNLQKAKWETFGAMTEYLLHGDHIEKRS